MGLTRGYLLDTQVLAWLDFDPKRIGSTTRGILERKSLFFGTPSVAELSFKRSLGKFRFSPHAPDEWERLGIYPLKFDIESAIAFGRFSSEWVPDPFDRMIMAIAAANNLVLLTSDSKILAQGFDWVFDATT